MGMVDLLWLIASMVTGFGLGFLYFGGLWWTIRQLKGKEHPLLFLVGSFVGRLAIVGFGFYLISGGEFTRLAVALFAFILMRFLLIRSVAWTSPQ